MAAGRNCLIVVFPLLTSIAAVILTLIVLLGSISNTAVLRDVYFLKVNISGLNVASLGLPSEITTLADSALATTLEKAGLHDFYTTGLWNYCAGTNDNSTFTLDYCHTPTSLYYFNPVTILEDDIARSQNNTTPNGDLSSTIEALFPTQLNDYVSVVKPLSNAMWILYIVGICTGFVSILVGGIFSFHSRCGSFCTSLISAVSFICVIIASGIATAMFTNIKNIFNDNAAAFGLGANIGKEAMVLTWVAVVCSLASTLFWVLSICCGSTRRSAGPIMEEKEPFIGYVGHQ